ncbi:MAG: hypothetical protein P8O90_06140 [Flavobacteriaceae bacterium]|nr:hypothetical protein [Flavobacteriaceae bacterium]
MAFSTHSCSLFLTLIFLSNMGVAQQNRDPFARSARPPDIGLGLAYNHNTLVKYKVPGGSISTNVTYYNFDKHFLLGLDYTTNIDKRNETIYVPRIGEPNARRGIFSKIIYNQNIYAFRGGWIFRNNFILVMGMGLESLKQFHQYRNRPNQIEEPVRHIVTGKVINIFYHKIGVMFKVKKIIFEAFYSQRGLGFGVNYFLNE